MKELREKRDTGLQEKGMEVGKKRNEHCVMYANDIKLPGIEHTNEDLLRILMRGKQAFGRPAKK